MLGAGDLADRLGARRLFIAGLALFGLGSAACAAAPGAACLVGARVVQGLGAAAILPTSLAVVNQLFPDPEERPRAIGAGPGPAAPPWSPARSSAASSLAPSAGGRSSGSTCRSSSPRWPGHSPCFPRRARPAPGRPKRTSPAKPSAALLAAVFALIEGGRDGFLSPATLIGGPVALTAFAAFLAAERRAPRPLLEPRWFRAASEGFQPQ